MPCASAGAPATASSPSPATSPSRCSGSPRRTARRSKGVEHFFHLAAIYDMTADEERNSRLNVNGTQHAIDLANELGAGHFHHASSIAVAGEYEGHFTEDSFDEGQKLSHPYHRTKYEAEKLVRQRLRVPWRVYRPSVVVGNSKTGEMDKIDGPYYFFKAIQKARHALPEWFPLVGIEVGKTNIVPGRLRRGGDGPHRAPARPRRPGLPPRRPEDDARGRRHQHLRPGRPRAEDGHPRRQEDDRHAAEGRALLRHEAAGAQGHPPLRCSPTSASRTRSSSTSASSRPSTRATPSARSPARGSSCRRWSPTPTSCGTTGSATSTPTSSRTAPSSTRSTARR